MRKSNWYEFRNQTEAMADLYLYGEVGGFGTNASEFIGALSQIKGTHINLHIHSPGGSVFEGHAIFNALRNHPAGVTTYIDGIAASMASVIAMAGKPVKIASNGFLMIHNPWSQAAGDSADMRKEADVLDKLKESLVKIYSDKSGMKPDEIAAAMDAETWFDAEEAVAFGLADEVFDGMQAAASIDVTKFSAKAPAGVMRFANPWPAPQWMRDNLKQGLEWYDKGFGGDGLAKATIDDAKAIAGGALVSPEKAQRMAAWFARHMGDIDGLDANTEPPTPGMVAHALWGGWPKADSEKAMAWAEAKWAEHEQSLNKVAVDRGTIAVDLDGTLAVDSGWKGIEHIGEPVPAMLERVKGWIADGVDVVIFTARANDEAALPFIEKWLEANGIGGLKITNVKTGNISEIWDNIAVRVETNTGKRIAKLMDNQPTAEAVAPMAEAVDALKVEVCVEISEEPTQDPNAPEQPMPEEPAMPEHPVPDTTNVPLADMHIFRISGLHHAESTDSIDFAAKLTEANALTDSLRAQIGERDAVIAKLTDELAKAKAEASVTPEKINALATRVVASAGHPAVEFTTGEPTALPKQDLVAQYNELRKSGKSAEWLAFLRKNRAALLAAAK